MIKKKNPHRHRQQYGDYQRGRRVGEVEEGKGDVPSDGKRLHLGW